MSKDTWQVFHAITPDGHSCGHQHRVLARAENCAIGLANRKPKNPIKVVRTTRRPDGEMNGKQIFSTVDQLESIFEVDPAIQSTA